MPFGYGGLLSVTAYITGLFVSTAAGLQTADIRFIPSRFRSGALQCFMPLPPPSTQCPYRCTRAPSYPYQRNGASPGLGTKYHSVAASRRPSTERDSWCLIFGRLSLQWGPLVLHSHRIESAKKPTHYHRRSSCLQEKQGASLPKSRPCLPELA